ncbi:hypothetical protein ACWD0A_04840 [Streptomyces sp. NPDC002867]
MSRAHRLLAGAAAAGALLAEEGGAPAVDSIENAGRTAGAEGAARRRRHGRRGRGQDRIRPPRGAALALRLTEC